MDSRYLAFVGVAALLTVTPGVDMALVTRNALAGGRRAALATTLGISLGVLTWAAASALGVAAVLAASPTAFAALQLGGAAYLVVLGLQTLWRTRRGAPERVEDPARHEPRAAAFRQGLLTNVLNPKIAVFYGTLLPQFLSPGDPALAVSLVLAGIHVAFGLVWLTTYAWFVTRADDVLRRPRVRRALDRLTGTVLVALGLRIVASNR